MLRQLLTCYHQENLRHLRTMQLYNICISQLLHQKSTEYQKNRFDMGSILQKQHEAEYKGDERLGSTKASVR